MKNNILKTMKKNYMYGIAIILVIAIVIMAVLWYKQKEKYKILTLDIIPTTAIGILSPYIDLAP